MSMNNMSRTWQCQAQTLATSNNHTAVKKGAKPAGWCVRGECKVTMRTRHTLWMWHIQIQGTQPVRWAHALFYRPNHHIHELLLMEWRALWCSLVAWFYPLWGRCDKAQPWEILGARTPNVLRIGMAGLLVLMRFGPCWALPTFCGILNTPYMPISTFSSLS